MADGDARRCAECEAPIGDDTAQVRTARGLFCAGCFARLQAEVQQIVTAQSQDIDFPRAVLGAVLGGAAGAALWWGVTVATNVAFGLIAIVIGIAVGKGVVAFSGGKRAPSLQVLSVAVAAIAYAAGTYLTTHTFLTRYLAEHGRTAALPLVPSSVDYVVDVLRAGFRPFDLVFLAIALHQAWRIPAPLRLGSPS
jgi:hypothetical protein